jgi:hypothetical protein
MAAASIVIIASTATLCLIATSRWASYDPGCNN